MALAHLMLRTAFVANAHERLLALAIRVCFDVLGRPAGIAIMGCRIGADVSLGRSRTARPLFAVVVFLVGGVRVRHIVAVRCTWSGGQNLAWHCGLREM